MLWFVTETALYASHFVLKKTFDAGWYLAFGAPKDPTVERIEKLENILEEVLENHSDELEKWYWKHRDTFKRGKWIVITKNGVLVNTSSKVEALTSVVELNKGNDKTKALIVQVGNESTMCEI